MGTIEIGAVSTVGAALVGLIVYLLRSRDNRATRVEKQTNDRLISVGKDTGDNTKDIAVTTQHLDAIGKRLSAGSEAFKDITETQKGLQKTQTIILTEFAQTAALEKEKDKVAAKFEKVDKSIDDVKEVVHEVKLSIIGIEKTMEGGIKSMRDLLAKLVTIPKHKDNE